MKLLEHFPQGLVACDLEVYSNYFLAGFKDIGTGETVFVEDCNAAGRDLVGKIMSSGATLVTFNGNSFDYPLLYAYLYGEEESYLKGLANALIEGAVKPWQALKRYKQFNTPHIDLIEVAPAAFSSLKAYGARMGMPRLQDLPIEHTALITPEQRPLLREYNLNDLDTTEMLLRRLEPELALRVRMTAEHNVDLLSKSDAQIAEHLLCAKMGVGRVKVVPPPSVVYRAPSYLGFNDDKLSELLTRLQETVYAIDSSGHVKLPEFLTKMSVVIGGGKYKMGVGGLHSNHDKKVCYVSADTQLIDFDVTSYYPNIMLNGNLNPPHLGPAFCRVFREVVRERVQAKLRGDKTTADTLKIVVNSSFGHLANRWSRLYAPEQMLAVTLTGQLTLLMLIERLELLGIPVVSANTDGIVVNPPTSFVQVAHDTVREFGELTNFEFEHVTYRTIALKDCNNYVAVKADRSVKGKGLYEAPNLKKNITFPACSNAVRRWLAEGVPFETTIRSSSFKDFLHARTVNGGGAQGETYLGRVVRWYMTTDKELPPITYVTNGNMVPRSQGGRACMTLPSGDGIPEDLDYQWYINECAAIAVSLGCATFLPDGGVTITQSAKKTRSKSKSQSSNLKAENHA